MTSSGVELKPGDPLLHLHGRWDESWTSWWGGTGFDIVGTNLTHLVVNCGDLTSASLPVGVSVNYAPYVTYTFHEGANAVDLPASPSAGKSKSVVRFVVEAWDTNNVHLLSVVLNAGAELEPYKPQKLKFQFIGDSHSAGQYLPRGIVDCYDWIVAEEFKAEKDINAQPGAALTDMECWGNVHGMSYQFFCVEDTRFFYNPKHNYTTPWDFTRDQPPTHVIIFLGANDGSEMYHVPVDEFTQTYKDFLVRLRTLYPSQPIFIFTNWGRWNLTTGAQTTFYANPSPYAAVVEHRHALGDKDVFLVDTYGWVKREDFFKDNGHADEAGQKVVARKLADWLRGWGLKAEERWEAAV